VTYANQPASQGSIRRRLLASLLAGAAVLAVVVYVMVLTVARQVAQDSQDNVLAASAQSILDSARISGGSITVDLPYAALSMLDSVSQERVFYAIRLGGEFLSGYDSLPEAGRPTSPAATFASTEFLGEEVRIATVRRPLSTDIGQQVLMVSVAQTLSGQKQTLAGIFRTSIAVAGGIFLLLVPFAALIARSTIHPLDRLTASVSRRGPQDLRPVAAPVPVEMGPLVTSLNTFMGRLQTSLSRSEEFIAEAAHRVRTPLAIVRTKAEIIQRKTKDAETRTALSEMIHAIDDSSRTAGQLLDHAMVTFRLDHLSEELVDLRHLIADSVDRLAPLSDLKNITLATGDLEALQVRGDPILLQNALQNILDNAIKYAPGGARVDVEARQIGAEAMVRVTDTGPGFPQTQAEDLTGRFVRGANAQGVVGSGLGLTIVQEVVRAHRGRMQTGNIDGGGACVMFFLPLA
jgi:two-component system sensor histidine kinase TctE